MNAKWEVTKWEGTTPKIVGQIILAKSPTRNTTACTKALVEGGFLTSTEEVEFEGDSETSDVFVQGDFTLFLEKV